MSEYILEVSQEVMESRGYRIPPRIIKNIVQESVDSVRIREHRVVALKRINDMQNELGRMTKLLDEMRADLLHLTVE